MEPNYLFRLSVQHEPTGTFFLAAKFHPLWEFIIQALMDSGNFLSLKHLKNTCLFFYKNLTPSIFRMSFDRFFKRYPERIRDFMEWTAFYSMKIEEEMDWDTVEEEAHRLIPHSIPRLPDERARLEAMSYQLLFRGFLTTIKNSPQPTPYALCSESDQIGMLIHYFLKAKYNNISLPQAIALFGKNPETRLLDILSYIKKHLIIDTSMYSNPMVLVAGKTYEEWAAVCGDMPGLVEAVCRRIHTPDRYYDKKRPLLIPAAEHGRARCVQHLIGGAYSTLLSKKEVGQALIKASFYGHTSCVSVLCKSHYFENAIGYSDETHHTALHHAAARGHLDVVKLFIEKNPKLIDVEVKTSKLTPLFLAIQNGKRRVVGFLFMQKNTDFPATCPMDKRDAFRQWIEQTHILKMLRIHVEQTPNPVFSSRMRAKFLTFYYHFFERSEDLCAALRDFLNCPNPNPISYFNQVVNFFGTSFSQASDQEAITSLIQEKEPETLVTRLNSVLQRNNRISGDLRETLEIVQNHHKAWMTMYGKPSSSTAEKIPAAYGPTPKGLP